ncbi:MAG TPA: hypothetical protein VGJ07_09395 [Rugosimonospora sp.]|jgi:hypothetical protein
MVSLGDAVTIPADLVGKTTMAALKSYVFTGALDEAKVTRGIALLREAGLIKNKPSPTDIVRFDLVPAG